MRRQCAAFTVIVVTLLASSFLYAQAAKSDPPTSKAQAALDQLKKLAGEWVRSEGENKGKLVARYTVASAGTAVVENLFPGTDHEMVTVYHLDGDKLMMTHYCAVGNQPRMHAEPATDRLVFTYSGGSNMKSEEDGHMHGLTLTFVDADHLKAEWTFQEKGQSKTETFNYERKK